MKRKIYKTNILKITETGMDSLLYSALLESIPNESQESFFKDYNSRDANDNLEIEFVVNGFSMHAGRFFAEFENQTDKMIRDAARKLIKEQCDELDGFLSNFANQLKSYVIEKAHAAIGFEYNSEEDWS